MSDDLCRFIETAFSAAPKPAFGTLALPTYDDEGTEAHFGRTDWRDHLASGLRAHEPSLGFFSPSAFRYYLPAFLIASIRHPGHVDVVPERVVSELQKAVSTDGDRLRAFSAAEREAMARWVEWWSDRTSPHLPRLPRQRQPRPKLLALADALRATSRDA